MKHIHKTFIFFLVIIGLSCGNSVSNKNKELMQHFPDTVMKDYTTINTIFATTLSAILYNRKKSAETEMIRLKEEIEHLKSKYQEIESSNEIDELKSSFLRYLTVLDEFRSGYLRSIIYYFGFAVTLGKLHDTHYNEVDNLVNELDIKKVKAAEELESLLHGKIQTENQNDKDY
jgi:hypothetical protein